MKQHLLIIALALVSTFSVAQDSIQILTWNIKDLGRTKDVNEIKTIAHIIKDYDVVAIQEVVAKDPAGAQKVAEIADWLNRMGSKWDYRVSDPTNSPSANISERYAYIWKTSKLRLQNRPRLDEQLADVCDREPYLIQFKTTAGNSFRLINFHSRPHNRQPAAEIAHFSNYPQRLGERLLILGDFNLKEDHKVWTPLYEQGFEAAIHDSPTTLKRKCNASGEYLSHAIDNIYFNSRVFDVKTAGRIDIVGDCSNLLIARSLSDHLPVYAILKFP